MTDTFIPDLLVGRTVVHYEITAKLGGGGMGVVYRARDAKLGRLVALKFLPPQWSHDETAKQRFIREAQAASATDHPNICTIHSIESTDDGQLFIVMAHYEGQTLKQKLEAGALATDQALLIATQVAEGLAKAHAQGVVHRDIKPGNLMITEHGVKILDFGLAKFADSLQLTFAGTTIGTVAYMSPEQARGQEADTRSDIWALGVVLYQMLTGEAPFKGQYPEAVSYAIRNEAPAPLRGPGRDISESLERLVLRALDKDPDRRFQTALELSREVRLLQGWTLPQEIRTGPVSFGSAKTPSASRGRRQLASTAAAVAIIAGAASWWLLRPVPRVPMAVAPVANLTGFAELDDYRLALTESLIDGLRDSPNVRVLPYGRVQEILRAFVQNGTDPTSREVLQALSAASGAELLIVPTLVNENGRWRARAEFRRPETAASVGVYETDAVASSLAKDTAYGLTVSLANGVVADFKANGPLKVRVVDALRRLTGSSRPPAVARWSTLDAGLSFERGLSAYGELEYVTAQQQFARAAEQDARSPLAWAWLSRAAQRLGRRDEALKAADQAVALSGLDTSPADALLVAATSAEARRDAATAEVRYRDLVARYPDEPAWLAELAGFEERQTRYDAAAALYLDALKLDSRLVNPHLQLCRLYSPTLRNEPTSAREHGRLALSGYKTLGSRGGEGQALMCLTDVLRAGRGDEQKEARQNAEAAVKVFSDLQYGYNLARAYNYVALAAGSQQNIAEAAAFWEKSLASARAAGNTVLEPLVLMNLGQAYEAQGRPSRAVDYRQQSFKLYEALGDQKRAAEVQTNRGAMLIEYGNPEEGLREVENALAVLRNLGDKLFEVECLQLRAAYYQNGGRHADAERELNQALNIARERDLNNKVADSNFGLARSRFELNDYEGARTLFERAMSAAPGSTGAHTRMFIGRIQVRVGDFDKARASLKQASVDLEARGVWWLRPVLHTALGELAYESGRLTEARTAFGEAAALWTTDELPHVASVEARAYLGLLDALDGRSARGEGAVRSSLEQARKMGRYALEATCRLFLARIAILERRPADALRWLEGIQPDGERSLGPELQAQAHYWRSRALELRGDRPGAQKEKVAAKTLVETVRASMPEQARRGFASRPDIRLMSE